MERRIKDHNMLQIKRILCPVDFSEFSVKAYDYAQSLARHYQAKLLVQHVLQPFAAVYPFYAFPDLLIGIYEGLRTHAEEKLRDFVNTNAQKGTEAEWILDEGIPAELILILAQKQNVDLIVMGTHGRQGMERVMLGSVTERVLRKVSCPVLAVREPAHDFASSGEGQDTIGLREILFCTDFSDAARPALQYALSLALEYDAELTLLHVLEEFPPDLETVTANIKRELEEPIPPDAREWCTIKSVVRVGKPYEQIIQFAVGKPNRRGDPGRARAQCSGSGTLWFNNTSRDPARSLPCACRSQRTPMKSQDATRGPPSQNQAIVDLAIREESRSARPS
ncbi:MAG: universal stress protein [Terriglobia bacterium]